MEILWEGEIPYVELKVSGQTVLLDLQDLDFLKYKYIAIVKRSVDLSYIRFTSGDLKSKYLHRVLLGIIDSNITVDHRNGNGLDNRRSNLRLATSQQNIANRVVFRNKKSGLPKGIYRSGDKYRARINWDYTPYDLGSFDTVEQAEVAYKKESERLHGEYAVHLSRKTKELS